MIRLRPRIAINAADSRLYVRGELGGANPGESTQA